MAFSCKGCGAPYEASNTNGVVRCAYCDTPCDEKFCVWCGEVIKQTAEICPECGVRQAQAPTKTSGVLQELISASATGPGKEWSATLLLCLLTGVGGGHRFYTGHTGIGVVQLLTFGGFFIWWINDLISIFDGSFRDVNGNPLVKTEFVSSSRGVQELLSDIAKKRHGKL